MVALHRTLDLRLAKRRQRRHAGRENHRDADEAIPLHAATRSEWADNSCHGAGEEQITIRPPVRFTKRFTRSTGRCCRSPASVGYLGNPAAREIDRIERQIDGEVPATQSIQSLAHPGLIRRPRRAPPGRQGRTPASAVGWGSATPRSPRPADRDHAGLVHGFGHGFGAREATSVVIAEIEQHDLDEFEGRHAGRLGKSLGCRPRLGAQQNNARPGAICPRHGIHEAVGRPLTYGSGAVPSASASRPSPR